MVKAAQQWTFDALWPVLSEIKCGKVFVPCGFSGLYEPLYRGYFRDLPAILRQFDHLIFYASDYRDVNFAKEHGISNFSIIPNGASEVEFSADPDPLFRERHGIGSDELLFLTVGSLSRMKGHFEVAEAFLAADLDGRPATLIINGNDPSRVQLVRELYCANGFKYLVKRILKALGRRLQFKGKGVRDQLKGVRDQLKGVRNQLKEFVDKTRSQKANKRVIVIDLPRLELVQAFMNADLFVFASHVEYSPLVLFESAAAGTPFLSVPVGNSEEIARWTGAGVICPAPRDNKGYTKVDPRVLAEYWSRLVKDMPHLRRMGAAGKQNWAEKFTWDKIASQYESIFVKVHREKTGNERVVVR